MASYAAVSKNPFNHVYWYGPGNVMLYIGILVMGVPPIVVGAVLYGATIKFKPIMASQALIGGTILSAIFLFVVVRIFISLVIMRPWKAAAIADRVLDGLRKQQRQQRQYGSNKRILVIGAARDSSYITLMLAKVLKETLDREPCHNDQCGANFVIEGIDVDWKYFFDMAAVDSKRIPTLTKFIRNAAREGIDRSICDITFGDARDMSTILPDTYDVVVQVSWMPAGGWPHSGDYAVSEALRVLKPGGTLVADCARSPYNYSDLLEDLGLAPDEFLMANDVCSLEKPLHRKLVDMRLRDGISGIPIPKKPDPMAAFFPIGTKRPVFLLPLRILLYLIFIALFAGTVAAVYFLWDYLDFPKAVVPQYRFNTVFAGLFPAAALGLLQFWRSMREHCRDKSSIEDFDALDQVEAGESGSAKTTATTPAPVPATTAATVPLALGLVALALKFFVGIFVFSLLFSIITWLPALGINLALGNKLNHGAVTALCICANLMVTFGLFTVGARLSRLLTKLKRRRAKQQDHAEAATRPLIN